MALTEKRLAEIRADRCAMETAEVVELLAEVDRLAKHLQKADLDLEAASFQVDEAVEARDEARTDALEDAIDVVLERQMKDSARMAGTDLDSGSCGTWCGPGKTCHGSEAHAALNRVLIDLRALDGAQ